MSNNNNLIDDPYDHNHNHNENDNNNNNTNNNNNNNNHNHNNKAKGNEIIPLSSQPFLLSSTSSISTSSIIVAEEMVVQMENWLKESSLVLGALLYRVRYEEFFLSIILFYLILFISSIDS